MDSPIDKTRLLLAIAEEHAALDSLLGTLDGSLLTQPGVYDTLAVTDVLAHLAAWESMEADWLQASLRGEPVVRFAPGFELAGDNYEAQIAALNAHILAAHRNRAPAAVLADLRLSQLRVLSAVQALSETDLIDPHRFAWWDGEPIWTSIAGNTYEHYREHRGLIMAWLASRPGPAHAQAPLDEALVSAWEANNQILLQLLDAIPAEALSARPGAKGRTVAQQLTHLHSVRLSWLDVAAPTLAQGLPRFERGARPEPPALRAALVASGEAIAGLLRLSLRAGQIKGFKAGPVAFFAYLVAHDAYHRGEIGVSLTAAGQPLPDSVAYAAWDLWGK